MLRIASALKRIGVRWAPQNAIQGAMLEIRQRYGKNAVVKGLNMLEGATTMERNMQIGGHKSGKTGALEPSEL